MKQVVGIVLNIFHTCETSERQPLLWPELASRRNSEKHQYVV